MMLVEINDDLDNDVDVVAVLQNNSNASNNDGLIPQLQLSNSNNNLREKMKNETGKKAGARLFLEPTEAHVREASPPSLFA